MRCGRRRRRAALSAVILACGLGGCHGPRMTDAQLDTAPPEVLRAEVYRAWVEGMASRSYRADLGRWAMTRRDELGIPPANAGHIAQGEVARGMTPVEVALAWGTPSRRIVDDTASGRLERWWWYGEAAGPTALEREVVFQGGGLLWWVESRR